MPTGLEKTMMWLAALRLKSEETEVFRLNRLWRVPLLHSGQDN